MKVSKRSLLLICLLTLSVLIHLFSRYTEMVESLYSTAFYKHFSSILRTISGIPPFSLGDVLYGLVVVWLIWKVTPYVRRRRKPSINPRGLVKRSLYKVLVMLCCLYIIFNISWGINYNRKGIASQLGLAIEKYSKEDLKELNCMLLEKVNAAKRNLEINKRIYPASRELFQKVTQAYGAAGKQYPFLSFQPSAMKPSLWDWAGNYLGFTGYYNPFTGEAQVSTSVPKFLQPFIACHEAAHQAGYAKEQEANFVGYLAGSMSTDTLLHYSVYLDLFVYANRNLYRTDSATAKIYVKDLAPSVLKDLQEWKDFNRRHRTFLEPIFRLLYGLFLRGNQQPQGLLAYDEVTGFMIAYYKKFGKI